MERYPRPPSGRSSPRVPAYASTWLEPRVKKALTCRQSHRLCDASLGGPERDRPARELKVLGFVRACLFVAERHVRRRLDGLEKRWLLPEAHAREAVTSSTRRQDRIRGALRRLDGRGTCVPFTPAGVRFFGASRSLFAKQRGLVACGLCPRVDCAADIDGRRAASGTTRSSRNPGG